MNYSPFIIFVLISIYVKLPDNSHVSDEFLHWQSLGSYFIKDDFKIFYIDYINDKLPENKVLICLHGFPTSSFDWIKTWQNLTSSFGRIVALDFLGYGFSDKPVLYEKYSIINQTDLLESLLDYLKITKFHIIAHDVGDTVAQELLHRNSPKKYDILSVCLLNGGIFAQTNHPRISQKLMAVPYIGRIFGYIINRYFFSHGFSEIFGSSTKPTSKDLTNFWKLIRYNEGHVVLPMLLQYIVERHENNLRWTEALQNTDTPIHIIFGDSDPVNPKEFINEMRRLVPKASIDVQEGVGHYPQWEAPDDTFKSFIYFIRDNDI